MGAIHDAMATQCGDQVLNYIRAGNAQYQQIFSTSISRTSDWVWPRPDYVCFDAVNQCTYALEFKPINQAKREYLCGLGQSLAYLQKHMYSGLIVPTVADDGFHISRFIHDTLAAPEFSDVGISLYEYDPRTLQVSILRGITKTRTVKRLTVATPANDTFWCWWRELSQYEILELLSLSFQYNEEDGDIYTNHIYPDFWNELSAGKTKLWEGTFRQPAAITRKNQEKQNYKIPLNQLGLWNSSTGKLTALGLKLLQIGKMYGANSQAFMSALAYLVLIDGKHLDLIKIVEDYQNANVIKSKQVDFLNDLENHLRASGFIGPGKPGAKKGTSTAKPSYVRDELKLWHKLGLVDMQNKKDYFFPNEGYRFNWHNISDVLVNGSRLING